MHINAVIIISAVISTESYQRNHTSTAISVWLRWCDCVGVRVNLTVLTIVLVRLGWLCWYDCVNDCVRGCAADGVDTTVLMTVLIEFGTAFIKAVWYVGVLCVDVLMCYHHRYHYHLAPLFTAVIALSPLALSPLSPLSSLTPLPLSTWRHGHLVTTLIINTIITIRPVDTSRLSPRCQDNALVRASTQSSTHQ
jgi:hypothetical protein